MAGEHFDMTDEPESDAEEASRSRRYLGVHFACCGVYSRIFANVKRTAYAGHCPRCGKPVHIPIGPGGSNDRFFTAY